MVLKSTTGERYRADFEREALPFLEAVHNFAFSLSKDAIMAEDLTQDTFLNAFRGFRNFKLGTSCKAWLFKICRNLFIDRIRRSARAPWRGSIDDSEPEHSDSPFESRTLEVYGLENETLSEDLFGDEVRRHLDELPDDFRQALLLCDLEGLSYQEITEIMGTPLGTVRSRISRARNFLRERLRAYATELGFLRDHELNVCPTC